jgi:transcriptional regulator with XRE-family HTH domain
VNVKLVCQILRWHADQQGITVAEVGRRLGASRQYAQQMLGGKSLSFESLEELGRAVNCEVRVSVRRQTSVTVLTDSRDDPGMPSSSEKSSDAEGSKESRLPTRRRASLTRRGRRAM